MSTTFNMYPTLTDEMFAKLRYIPGELVLLYKEGHDHFPLALENRNGDDFAFCAELRDPRCEWYPEKYNLLLRKTFSVIDASPLFGAGGIVPASAVIGVAVRWISSKSEHRGIVCCGELVAGTTNTDFHYEQSFDRNTIKGSVLLETVLYLKSTGVITKEEQHLAQQTGTILGVLDSCEMFVDGNGSIFPVATVNDSTKPLWWVYYDEACDPLQDPFEEEYVEIRLNRAHPAFELLKIDGSLKDSPLFLEVISSALLVIVDSVKESLGEDWTAVLSGQGFANGSIAEAIHYFVVKLQWDTSSTARLAQSIRKFFDDNLKGGTL